MLKFFKVIKRKLLDEGNIKKYFLYAIGEILLIVIGILIALELGNLNQTKISKNQEKIVLIGLKSEIKSNLKDIELIISEKTKIVAICNILLAHTGKNSKWEEKTNFDSLLVKTIVSGWKFNPATGVVLAIINSGKLDLIRNDSLRYIIAVMPGDIDKLQYEDDMVINDLHNTYLPFISKHYPIRNTNIFESGVTSVEQRKMLKKILKSDFDSSPQQLLNNSEFENLINIQLIWVNFSLNLYCLQKIKYEQTLGVLDKELLKL